MVRTPWLDRPAVGAIRAYQRYLSPALGARCRYEPSCSEYGAQAIAHYGALRGVPMTAWRLLRCNPFAKGGYDPPFADGSAAADLGPDSHDEAAPA